MTAWGYPLGEMIGVYPTVTRGAISSKRTLADTEWLQTDVVPSPVRFGGPLVDRYGRAIGVVSRNSTRLELVNIDSAGFAIASNEVRRRLDALEAGGPDSAEYRNAWQGHGYSVAIPKEWYLRREEQECTTFATYHREASAEICAYDVSELIPDTGDELVAFAEWQWNRMRDHIGGVSEFFEPISFQPTEIGGTRYVRMEYRLKQDLPPGHPDDVCIDHRIMMVALSGSYPDNRLGFT